MNAKIAILSIIVAVLAMVGIASAVFYPSGSILATGNKTQDIGDASKYFRTLYIENITIEDELTDAQVSDSITATNYYLKTEIDTQGEVETIWSVTLATDSEVTTANTSMKDYVDAADSAQDDCSEITGCVENALTAELDPYWTANQSSYYTSSEVDTLDTGTNTSLKDYCDATFLTSYTENDPHWTANHTTCATGNHLYFSSNNLACEADDDSPDTDAEVPDNITIDSSGTDHRIDDNDKWYFGTGNDAYISWDSAKLVMKVN